MEKKKIFISSVQSEFAEERKAIAAYIRQDALLSRYFDPFLFEELPAQDQSAQRAYLDEVAQTEVYLLLVGEQYGNEDQDGVSPTEREFDAASANHAYRIAMLKRTTNRQPKEQRFADKVDKEVIRNTFDSVDALKSGLYAALVEYMQTHGILSNGPFDATIQQDATLADLDKEKIAWFVGMAREKRQFPLTYAEDNIPQILRSLHLITDDNRIKNAALLLFAKDTQKWFSTATVKCVQFYGTKKQKPILTQHIYSGTVFDMVDEAVGFVMAHIDVRGGERTHSAQAEITPEIPTQAIAEAIVNAVVHRDYTSNGSVQVELYSDRLEIWNPGHLPHGLTIAKLSQFHNSMPQNPILAHPVYLAGYIEQIGTGTTDIVELCRQEGLRVEFKQEGDFTTIIYRPTGQVTGQVGEQAAGQATEQVTSQVIDIEKERAGQVREQVTGQATGQVRNPMERIVLAIGEQKLTRQEVMDALILKGRDNFRVNYLEPSIRLGYVRMLYAGASNHPNQAYYLTKKGLALYRNYVVQMGKEDKL
ncbi:MAG: DUF4062 domain-containing protein [Paludibacteraceae bacterium]|nr:DUF4062 domain-containing protein [Paludibacteraceae bacterium]